MSRTHRLDATPAPLQLVIATMFALIVASAGLTSLPPLDRDEARFAQATAQMLESGDFVSIRFQDEERNKKPAGIHWLQAASVSALSSVEAREVWAYRLPSMAGVVIAVAFTYLAGLRLYGPRAGFLAALLLAAAPLVAGEATIAKTDAMLLGCITAAQTALLYLYAGVKEQAPARPAWTYAFWIALGAGVLIKGPIAPLVSGLTIAVLLSQGPRADFVKALRPLRGLAIVATMVLPWAAMIGLATEGRFFTEALGGDMAGKIGAAQERHGGPPGYHLLLVWLLLWPAAALITPGLAQVVRTRAVWQSLFLLGWIAPSWIIFELTATKLPHYPLPLYPALALLAAQAACSSGDWRHWFRRSGVIAYAVIGALAAAGMIALSALYGAKDILFWSVTAATILMAMTGLSAFLFWRGEAYGGAIGAAATSAFLAFALLNGVLPNLQNLAVSPRLAAALERETLEDAPAALAGFTEPSAIFLLGTQTVLTDGAGAARHLATTKSAASIVEEHEQPAFYKEAQRLGLRPAAFATVSGVNYSKGEDVTLTLYKNGNADE